MLHQAILLVSHVLPANHLLLLGTVMKSVSENYYMYYKDTWGLKMTFMSNTSDLARAFIDNGMSFQEMAA